MTKRDHTSSSPMYYFFVLKRFEKKRETKDGKMNARQIAFPPPSPLRTKISWKIGERRGLYERGKNTRRRMGTRGGGG